LTKSQSWKLPAQKTVMTLKLWSVKKFNLAKICRELE
jgi:hypothetical protein